MVSYPEVLGRGSKVRSSLTRALIPVLALGVSLILATTRLPAQSSSSQPEQPAAQAPSPQAPMTVQQRIKMRREQRRAAAIHDVYSHLYEVYVGAGYERFFPGNGIPPQNGGPRQGLQRMNEYMWNVGVTRYFNERLGVALDGRGTYGTAFIGIDPDTDGAEARPSISQYTAMAGPTYRFLLHPRYSISGRLLGGFAYGNFSGDLGSFTTAETGLWPNGGAFAVSASLPVEYNASPELGFRVAPEYLLTNFGSTIQNNRGFTAGVVVRWGKQ